MSLEATGVTIQLDIYQEYQPGSDDCDCFACTLLSQVWPCSTTNGILDWNYSYESCCFSCPDQLNCSKPNPGDCPTIGGNNGIVEWNSVSDAFNPQSQGRLITCTYNVTDFQSSADINTWINTFGTGGDLNSIIMPFYCSQLETENACPTFPPSPAGTTGCPSGLTGCSRLSATNSDGALCRQWLAENPTLGPVAAGNFCLTNTCAADCQCYNRGEVDPIYILITESPDAPPPTEDACWYKPCQQSPPFLVPTDQIIQPGTCPSTICQQVNNVIGNQGSNVNITVAQEEISCTLSTGGGGDGGGGGNPSYIGSIWDQYHVWIIAGAAILLTLVVILIIIAVVRGKRSNK